MLVSIKCLKKIYNLFKITLRIGCFEITFKIKRKKAHKSVVDKFKNDNDKLDKKIDKPEKESKWL